MDSDVLVELWERVKPLIPAKERLEAADAFVAVFDQYALLTESDRLTLEHDKELKAAFVSIYGIAEEEDDEWG